MSTPILAGVGIAAVLCLSGCLGASAGGDRDGSTASVVRADELAGTWRWKHRILLVWSDHEADLVSQADLVRDRWHAWCDRDLLLVLTEPEGGVVVERFVDGGPVGPSLEPPLSRAICDRFGMDDRKAGGFSAVLVGKDGGVKHRYHRIVDLDEVFSRIDAMPMRIREMRDGS